MLLALDQAEFLAQHRHAPCRGMPDPANVLAAPLPADQMLQPCASASSRRHRLVRIFIFHVQPDRRSIPDRAGERVSVRSRGDDRRNSAAISVRRLEMALGIGLQTLARRRDRADPAGYRSAHPAAAGLRVACIEHIVDRDERHAGPGAPQRASRASQSAIGAHRCPRRHAQPHPITVLRCAGVSRMAVNPCFRGVGSGHWPRATKLPIRGKAIVSAGAEMDPRISSSSAPSRCRMTMEMPAAAQAR